MNDNNVVAFFRWFITSRLFFRFFWRPCQIMQTRLVFCSLKKFPLKIKYFLTLSNYQILKNKIGLKTRELWFSFTQIKTKLFLKNPPMQKWSIKLFIAEKLLVNSIVVKNEIIIEIYLSINFQFKVAKKTGTRKNSTE